jgi:hypothetical protein
MPVPGILVRILVLTAAAFLLLAPQSWARQSNLVTLFDGTLEGWTPVNTDGDRFTIVDGLLRVEGGAGWLRADNQYTDFTLRAEFRWLTEDADSGIYVRAVADSEFIRGWPNNSYQVQVRDPAGESRFPPVGGLFRHGTPPGDHLLDETALDRAYRGTGEWHTIEIEMIGTTLRVVLNGIEISRSENITNAAGFIGLQSELGSMEYRSIEIAER